MGRIVSSEANISKPEPLTSNHDLAAFSSGQATLDNWLKQRALKSHTAGSARTYVVVSGDRVVGYYSLAVGSIQREAAVSRVRRNAPDPVPVMILARLAIDTKWQGRSIGRGLLKDAVCRTVHAAKIAGIRTLLVHALTDDAKRFYEYFGFQASPIKGMTLMATMAQLQAALA